MLQSACPWHANLPKCKLNSHGCSLSPLATVCTYAGFRPVWLRCCLLLDGVHPRACLCRLQTCVAPLLSAAGQGASAPGPTRLSPD